MHKKFQMGINAFPGDYCNTNQRTVNLSPGDGKVVFIHIEYGGGSARIPWYAKYSIPHQNEAYGSNTAGMWSIQKFNAKDIETQLSQFLCAAWPRTKPTIGSCQ